VQCSSAVGLDVACDDGLSLAAGAATAGIIGLILWLWNRRRVRRTSSSHELEDAALASWLEREALYGDFPVLERGEGTKTGATRGTLAARQSRASVASRPPFCTRIASLGGSKHGVTQSGGAAATAAASADHDGSEMA
jgi:hypothetical protein